VSDTVEQQVLSETRMRIGIPADQLPDETVKATFAYQSALLHARIQQLGRDIVNSSPGPLRKLARRLVERNSHE
jgi:hypothetical protein